MADTGAPGSEVSPPDLPTHTWPNKKEDYELLEVIGQYLPVYLII